MSGFKEQAEQYQKLWGPIYGTTQDIEDALTAVYAKGDREGFSEGWATAIEATAELASRLGGTVVLPAAIRKLQVRRVQTVCTHGSAEKKMKLAKFDKDIHFCFARIEFRNWSPSQRGPLAKIHFTKTMSDKLGLGTTYKSCDLYWAEEEETIVLEVFRDPTQGQRKLTIAWRGCAVSATLFLKQFDIQFTEKKRYRVRKEGDYVHVILKDGQPVWTQGEI